MSRDFSTPILGPLLGEKASRSAANRRSLNRFDGITRYGGRCAVCGNMQMERLRFTTTELVAIQYHQLRGWGWPSAIRDVNGNLRVIFLLCDRCLREARKVLWQ